MLLPIKTRAIRDKVKNQEAIRKEYQISQLETVIKQKDEALMEKEKALNNICNSTSWKVLLKCFQIRDKILPPDCWLRRAFNKLWENIISS